MSASSSPHANRIVLPGSNYHRVRKAVQIICVLIFTLLPLTNLMRFDLVSQRFYFFGVELRISEFAILFLAMMFVWILVAASAMIYGRFWCGYLCPQMIFSEASLRSERDIQNLVKKVFKSASETAKKRISKSVFYLLGIPPSIFFAFIFVAYFVPSADLFNRLIHFDLTTAAGIVCAAIALVTFVDFAILRTRFCTGICPYGYLQNMLADKNTLLVRYDDPEGRCIKCNKCVSACPMEIDIRNSSHQFECTHCAECIDACSGILGKMGRETLISYAWGEFRSTGGRESWFRRLGLRDGKRAAILVLLAVYATGLALVVSLRKPVLVQIMPDRMTLYTIAPDGLVHNHFRLMLSNRSHSQMQISLSVEGLQQGVVSSANQPISLAAGDSVQTAFDVIAPAGAVAPGVNHMKIVAQVSGQKTASFDETFITPMDSPKPSGMSSEPQSKK